MCKKRLWVSVTCLCSNYHMTLHLSLMFPIKFLLKNFLVSFQWYLKFHSALEYNDHQQVITLHSNVKKDKQNLTFTAPQTSPDKSLCDWSRAIVGNQSEYTRHTMDCEIIESELVLQSHCYDHLRANTLGKGMNPLILPAMG